MSSASSLSSSPPPDQCGSRLFNGRSRRQNVDYGVRNQLISQLNKRELYGLDVYRWEDDDLALRHAASNARLPYDRMTLRELQIFVEMTRSQASINLFLYLRNRILVLWQLDPLIELTIEAIQKEIPEPYNSDYELVKGVHNYLQRYGYINFGVFLPLSNFVLDKPHRIIIIGAGTSGLIAARQLKFFGFDVTVLEGRQRTGGRVFTIRQPGLGLPPVDSGGMIINGIIGNPLITLIQQNLCNVVRMNPKCPIYDSRGQGKMVDARKDDMIQKSFNRILSTISYIVHSKEITDIGGDENGRGSRKISLGEAFQLILDQHELRVQSRRLNYWKKYELLCNKLRAAIDRIKYSRKAIDECMEQLRKNGISISEPTPEMLTINFEDCTPREEFIQKLGLRCIRKCLQLALKEFEEAEQERKDIEHILNDYKNMEPSHVFMNDTDKRILDFHLANLEYGIGGPLSSVALKDWDLDDPYGFAGSHMTVKEGLGSVIERLHADLKIELNSVVNHVEYNEQGVSVKYIKQKQESKSPTPSNHQSQETSEIHTLQADAVLCTVPLGVLKMSPFLSEGDESGNGAIRFQPPLPTWKREAITRLGFGNLNKLILFFEKPFWDITKSSFGRLNDICTARGELFLFFTNGDLPILIGLFAGEAAAVTSQFDEEVIVQRGMKALHSIFGNICPPKPINFKITRWHVDRFSRGCYSYMSSNSLADDYDLLARPIHPNEDESILPRIFFAGEHTNRQHPSSVHGAFLSGLREAAQIADTFIGQLSFSGQNFHLDEESAELLASSYDEQLNIGKNAESSGGQNGEEQQNNHCEEENEVNGTESMDSDSDIELL